MSCGVSCRRDWDPALLWLWCRPAAIAPIGPLAWEPPCAMTATSKSKKKNQKTTNKSITSVDKHNLWVFSPCFAWVFHCCEGTFANPQSRGVKCVDSEVSGLGLNPALSSLAVLPWASYSTSLSLSCFLYKAGLNVLIYGTVKWMLNPIELYLALRCCLSMMLPLQKD